MSTKKVCVWTLFSLMSLTFCVSGIEINEVLKKYVQISERTGNSFLNSLYGVNRNYQNSSFKKGTYESGSLTLQQGYNSFVASMNFSFSGAEINRELIVESTLPLNNLSLKNQSDSSFPVKVWDGSQFSDNGDAVEDGDKYYYLVQMAGLAGSKARITSKTGAAVVKFYVEKPNILLIIMDDYGVDIAPPPYQNSLNTKTPVINGLIKAGTTFVNCWVNPMCSPTRAAMMTGRYGYNNGVGYVIGRDEEMDSSEFTLPQAIDLSPAGYKSALIGKWHLGEIDINYPAVMGWEHFSGILQGGIFNYYSWNKYINGTGPIAIGSRSEDNPDAYTTTVFVNDALDWIAANEDQPWFTWLALNAVHTPIQLPPANLHTYDDDGENLDDPLVQFKAMVEATDTEIGRLTSTLKEAGELQNTLVFFIGDNGTDSKGVDLGTEQKGTIYEGGVKVPFVIWAGKNVVNFEGGNGEETRLVANVVNGVDIFSTIAAITGVNNTQIEAVGKPLDSVSILPYLQGETSADSRLISPALRDIILSERFNNDGTTSVDNVSGKTVRNLDYKLIIFGDGTRKLFKSSDNLGTIDESVNLLDSELAGEDLENYNTLKNHLEPIFNP